VNVIERLEGLAEGDTWTDSADDILAVRGALPALLKLAQATWALMDADRRILAYPPHREAAIKKAALEVEAALESLFGGKSADPTYRLIWAGPPDARRAGETTDPCGPFASRELAIEHVEAGCPSLPGRSLWRVEVVA
jgi:hypothetical protein